MAERGDDEPVDTGEPVDSEELGESGETEIESWLRDAAHAPDGDLAGLLPRPGDLLASKYRVDALIGKGGMGAVFAAENLATGKRVALKWMLPRDDAGGSAAARFAREARVAGRIDHPNVVAVYDAGEHGGAPFLVMELLRGQSLRRRIDEGALSPVEAVRTVMYAARGVAAAHAQGVIHRDLKPDNIFLCRTADGAPREPKVLDFGIAKVYAGTRGGDSALTRDGSMLGTPAYMAPEQARGARDLDARADVYALGAILYHCLTGRLPYEATTYNALIVKIATEDPERLGELRGDLPEGLDAVVERAMARDRDARYPNVDAFARALEPFADGLRFRAQDSGDSPGISPGAGAPTPTPREGTTTARVERGGGRALWLGGALLALLAGGGFVAFGSGGGAGGAAGDGRAAGGARDGDGTASAPAAPTATAAAAVVPTDAAVPLPLKPDPARVAACGACAADKCQAERAACEAEPHCAAHLWCARGCDDPDCAQACDGEHPLVNAWQSPSRDGAEHWGAYRRCVYDDECLSECGRGDNFACTGNYQPAPATEPFEVEVTVAGGGLANRPTGVSGVGVKTCQLLQPECLGGEQVYTDSRGVARLSVSGPGGVFRGFLQWQGRKRHRLVFPPPLSHPWRFGGRANVGNNESLFGWASNALGVELDMTTTGLVVVLAPDCAGAPAAGLRLSLTPNPEQAVPFYFKDAAWSRLFEVTQRVPLSSGPAGLSGGFARVPAGRYLLQAHRAEGGGLHAEREILVREGADVVVVLPPQPR